MEKENLKTKAKAFWNENSSAIITGCAIATGIYAANKLAYVAGYVQCLADVMEAIDENSAK